MKNAVLILGATSSIAKATAAALAEKGHSLFLASRDLHELERMCLDFKIRYPVDIQHTYFDADDVKHHSNFFHQVIQKMGSLEGIVVAFGEAGDQQRAIYDFNEVEKIFNRNFVGSCAILTSAANYFHQEKKGFIVAISSTAADRANKHNYVYASAKAGLSVFLQGLRHRLYASGIQVLTVKPYFVDTAATFGDSSFFKPSTPEYVGKRIVKALKKSKQELYIPSFWRYMMFLAKLLPEKLLRRI